MRHWIVALLALSTLPTLGCPPNRSGGSGGDDDDDSTAEPDPIVVSEGYWQAESVSITLDDCGVAQEATGIGFELRNATADGVLIDWYVDAPNDCSLYGSELTCPQVAFRVAEEEGTELNGTIDLDGEFVSGTELDGVTRWTVTCSGLDCEGYELPTDMACTFVLDGTFVQVDLNEPEPEPGDGEDSPPPGSPE